MKPKLDKESMIPLETPSQDSKVYFSTNKSKIYSTKYVRVENWTNNGDERLTVFNLSKKNLEEMLRALE